AALSGRKVTLDIRRLMAKRAHLIGSTLRGRPLAEKARIRSSFIERFGAQLDDGRLKPVIDAIYPLAEVQRAHERMRENLNIGKIVLEVRPAGSASDARS